MEDTIGRRVAQERERLRLTQAQLADQLGVKQQTVGSWESGKSNPPTDKLARLSEVLDVSIDYLVLGQVGRGGERERIQRLRHALDLLEEALTDEAGNADQTPR